jgi:hypothetical protein
VIIAIGYVDTFKEAWETRMEFFNELMLMITSYHLFCFSDFVPDVQTRDKVGNSLMVCTIINVAVNLTVTFSNPIYRLW